MAEEYKSVHTGPDIDAAVTRALPGGGIDQAINAKPNPNLLDNAYFGNPVNQREQTEWTVTTSAYFLDRWVFTSANTALSMSVSEKGLLIPVNAIVHQTIEHADILDGKMVTFSILYNGEVTSASFVWSKAAAYTTITTDKNGLRIAYDGGQKFIQIFNTVGESATAVAVKLELGYEQTLAHKENSVWVLNEIPNFAEELAKCQRCYQVFSSADKRPANPADYRPTLRANPVVGTIDINGTIYYFADANP